MSEDCWANYTSRRCWPLMREAMLGAFEDVSAMYAAADSMREAAVALGRAVRAPRWRRSTGVFGSC